MTKAYQLAETYTDRIRADLSQGIEIAVEDYAASILGEFNADEVVSQLAYLLADLPEAAELLELCQDTLDRHATDEYNHEYADARDEAYRCRRG